MSDQDVGSGGSVERSILFIAGCMMGAMGCALAYIAYRLSLRQYGIDYQEFYMGGSIGLAFFLLRGAWYTVMPEKKQTVIKMTHDR